MSHFMISFDPCFVHFKNTACLVPPQQIQIDIIIPGMSNCYILVIFTSLMCHRSKRYHI